MNFLHLGLMLRNMSKKFLLVIFGFFLALLFGEIILRLCKKDSYLAEMNILLEPPYQKDESNIASIAKRHLTMYKRRPKMVHPYFGYTYDPSRMSEVNKDGFIDPADFSQIFGGGKQTFNIAVLGGSVAQSFALQELVNIQNMRPNILSHLKSKLPRFFSGKKLKLMNLAIDGHKQPQQYFVASFYLEKIDMAIVIDGFNEIGFEPSIEFPIQFPGISEVFFNQDRNRLQNILHITQQVDEQIEITNFFKKSFLSKSYLMGALWQSYMTITNGWIFSWSKGGLDKTKFYYKKKLTFEQRLEEQAIIWKKYSEMLNEIFRNKNIPFFHFIQPNQHIPGSKTLTEEEKKLFFDNSLVAPVKMGYEFLSAEQGKMKKNGYSTYSLVNIFQKTRETIYVDSCCHLNIMGNEIMRNEIVEIVSKHISKNPNSF